MTSPLLTFDSSGGAFYLILISNNKKTDLKILGPQSLRARKMHRKQFKLGVSKRELYWSIYARLRLN
jgi:hypothetical protein